MININTITLSHDLRFTYRDNIEYNRLLTTEKNIVLSSDELPVRQVVKIRRDINTEASEFQHELESFKPGYSYTDFCLLVQLETSHHKDLENTIFDLSYDTIYKDNIYPLLQPTYDYKLFLVKDQTMFTVSAKCKTGCVQRQFSVTNRELEFAEISTIYLN